MPKSVLYDEAEVINRATNLFWTQGYHATSMQDIVEATGLNRSSIYNSFIDKFGLFKACLAHYQKAQDQFTEGLFKKKKSAKESLISLFKGIEQDISNNSEKGCFISNCTAEMGANNAEIRDFLIDNKNHMIEVFSSLISQAQQDGDISNNKNPKHLAMFLFSNLHGLRLTGIIENDKEAISAISEQVISIL